MLGEVYTNRVVYISVTYQIWKQFGNIGNQQGHVPMLGSMIQGHTGLMGAIESGVVVIARRARTPGVCHTSVGMWGE